MRFRLRATMAVGGILLMSACSDTQDLPPACVGDGCEVVASCDDFDRLKRPLFGDTHVHTAFSFDAAVRGTRLGPEGAYQYARGEAVGILPFDEQERPLRTIQRDRPLDFVVISDHAEFLGAVSLCTDPTQPAYSHPECGLFRAGPGPSFAAFGLRLTVPPESAAYPSLCGEAGELCVREGLDIWRASIEAAEGAQDRSDACEFSALIGYEWTAVTGFNNLHRNVVFRSGIVPDQPATYFDAPYVEDLWERLRSDCIDAGTGCDALTIPHNSNLSNGAMFATTGRDGALDARIAAERAFMEPLIEIYQHKGESECKPGETISDELCGFEKLPFNDFVTNLSNQFVEPNPRDFVRDALGRGMQLEADLGTNPFKYGIIASTDTHIAAPGSAGEPDYPAHSTIEGAERKLPVGLIDVAYRSPGGLAGVWAEENSREAIFQAMRRKEVFGTSGTHIVVRTFGGWDFPADICDDPDLARVGYERGVPMGADLAPPPAGLERGPTFVVSAMQDPGAGDQAGTPLQRLQVVKGWLDASGDHQVRVFEIAGNPDNGAAVDLATCEPEPGSGGFASLCARWTDPTFDPARPAYYYVRAVENPTCRWTQYACNTGGVDCSRPETVTEGFEECCDLPAEQCAEANVDCDAEPIPDGFSSCCRPPVPKTIQERAWTSPMWHVPSP